MNLRQQIINKVGTNNLFRLQDVAAIANKNVLKSMIYRWTKVGDIKKYRNGYYYFANHHKIEDKIFYNDSFNFFNFVKNTYLLDKDGKTIGIESGQNYLSGFGIDTQLTTKHIIYTNNLLYSQKICWEYRHSGKHLIPSKYID